MSQKDGPIDPAEASKTTQDIHQGEKASETTTQNIEEYVNEEEIPVDEHPQSSSAPKTTGDKSLQDEETREQKVTGLEVELDTGLQKDSTDDVREQEGRTPDIASASQDSQPQEYEKDIKGAPAGNKMKEITTEELVKSVSKDHGHEILTEPEDTEIQEKHPEVAVTDLASKENQSNTTSDAIEIIHDEFTNEEVRKRELDAAFRFLCIVSLPFCFAFLPVLRDSITGNHEGKTKDHGGKWRCQDLLPNNPW